MNPVPHASAPPPGRRRRRALRRLAVIMAVVMISNVAVAGTAPPGHDRFPLDWLRSLFSAARVLAAPVTGLPVQPWGGRPGPGHVPATQTDAGRGAGTAPGKGIGALPAYVPPARPGKPTKTGTIAGDASFSATASRRIARDATAHSDVYANPDGSYTRKVYQDPVNFKAADGTWTPIDVSLTRGADGRLRQRANSVGTDLAARADDAELLTVRADDRHAVAYALAGARPVAPRVDGDTAVYPGVLPGVDLTFQTRATGIKESLVLHSADAPTSYLFPLALTGLTPRLEPGGAVTLRDAAGTVRAGIPRGHMVDSRFDRGTGAFTRSDAVRYELVPVAGGTALRVTLDAAWLRDPARVFPVTVDPTTNLNSTGDTYAYSSQAWDHSSEDELLAGTWNGTSKAHSFIHFNSFGSTYAGATMNSVSLKIFDSWASTCTPEPFTVHPITAAWTESGVTSYPGPSFGSAIGTVTADPGAACTNTGGDRSIGTWMTVPLATATFQNWAQGGTNNGLAVTASQTDITQWKRFTSRNGPAGKGPYLQVTYTVGNPPQVDAQSPSNGYAVSTLTPELLAAAHDPDGTTSLQYLFAVYDKNGVKLKDSGWITARSWVVPANTLTWGQTYNWTVTASDGGLTSSSQTVNQLSTAVPQPLVTSELAQNGGPGFHPNSANYTTATTDASVETVGPDLAIARSYNSQDPRTGQAFGAGWSSLVDTQATEQRDAAGALATVTITYPGGQDVTFGRNTDGSFTPPLGRYASFTAVTGGYQLVDKDGTRYLFTSATASAGRYGLTSVTDAQGRAETFTYDSAKRLSTITSASGRALHLTWSTPAGAGAAHVATVSTDPATPGDSSTVSTWQYGYSGDQLTRVCPPTSGTACTTYTYGTGSIYPTALLNAGPKSYWRFGESGGNTVAASAVLDNYGTDNATYSNVTLGQPGPLPGSTATAAAFDGSSSMVRLPADLAASGSYLSLSLWFKAAAGDQGPLFTYQADPASNATTAGNYTPALYIGTSGKLYGQFWDGSVGPISTGTAVTDGRWHHVVLSGAGGQQWLYLDGAAVGSRTGAIRTVNAYSAANEYLGAGFLGGKWPDEPHYSSTDNTGHLSWFKGSLSDAAFFDRSLTAADVAAIHQTGTRVAHPLTSIVRPSGNATATIAYDSGSNAVRQVTDANGGVWKLNAPTVSGSSKVYASAVLGAAPVDYWRLAETGTTDAINQVNGNTATYNAVTLGTSGGPFDDATVAGLDGGDSYLKLPAADVPTTGPTSVSMWFKTPSGSTTGGVLFGYQTGPVEDPAASSYWTPAIYVGTDGKLRGQIWTGSKSPITSTTTVNDGQWHHVALSAGTSTQSLYLDGERVGTLDKALVATNAQQAFVGAGKWTSWPGQGTADVGYFSGQVAEVAFYRSQLSEAQVANQFAARDKSTGTPAKTVTMTDPGGHTISHVYDVDTGRELAEIDALGNETKYGYDVGGFLRTVTDPNGNVTTEEHDVRGNVVSSTTCQDRSANKCSTVYYTYYPDATTRVLSPDPRNDVMLTVRDGRSASATDDTYLTTYTYDAKGNRTAVTDPLGRVTKTAYTDGTTVAAYDGGYAPAGLPMTVTTAGGAVQSVVYYRTGDVATVTDPAGKVTLFTYDGLGNVVRQTEITDSYPDGLVTSFRYDKLGREVSQTDPATTNRVTGAVHTAVTTTTYDDDGRITAQTITDTTGGDAPRSETRTYNAHGQQASITDPAGNVTRFEYDVYGNVVREIEADGGETVSAYDAEGNLLTTTLVGYVGDPNDPSPAEDLVIEANAYDPAGRLASETDAMGWVTEYTYTDNGLTARVTRRDPTSGSTFVQADDSYDAAGNLVRSVTNNGATTTTYVVDAANRTASETLDPNGLNRTTSYEYNRDDQVVAETMTDAAGATVGLTETMYDPAGRELVETTHTGTGAPVARWRLNQNAGSTAVDSSGNNPGAATGITWSTAHGGSATFNGTSSVIETDSPAVDTSRSFTVAAWVNLTDTSAMRKALGTVGVQQDSFDLRYDNSNNRWRFVMKYSDTTNAGGIAANSTSVPALNTWTHLVGVYDATTDILRLYVNGTQEGSASNRDAFNACGPLLIGAGIYNAARDNYWKGGISDVQVYSRALSATEVSAVYKGTAPAADAQVTRVSYDLDQDGLARAVTDPNGNVTNYAYDEAGRLTVTTGPAVDAERDGGAPVRTRPVSVVGYDTFGEEVEERDPNGNVVVTGYDAEGREVSTTMPAYTPPGSSTTITPASTSTYDALGQLTATTDPLGRTTRYEYDQLGRVAKMTHPDGGVRTYTYDPLGDELSETDPTGAKTTATYDYLGRKLTETEVVRQTGTSYTTRYTYGTGGWLASASTPGGATTSYTYNADGDPVTMRDPAGNTTRFDYDGAGRQVRATSPDGTYTVAAYDLSGRQTATKEYSAGGTLLRSTSDRYDPSGNVVASTDGRGTVTTFTYDPTGMVTSQVEKVSATDSITSTFGYDAGGNQTRFTDGRGNPFLVTYNSWNLPEKQIEPATAAYPDLADRTFTMTYDANGQLTRLAQPGGVSVGYEYDQVGNLTRQTGTGAEVATADRSFAYDLAGRIIEATAADGTNRFTYDDRDLLLEAAGPSGNSSFSYTPDGLMASRTDAAGRMDYGYDGADRLVTMSNADADIQASLTYDNLSQVKTITYGAGGNVRSFSYDDLHRLVADEVKTSAGATIGKITYGYDANDNVTSKTTTGFAGSASNTYSYDLADRLVSWNNGSTTTTYAYDRSGNRTQVGNRTFTYDARNQLVNDSNGTSYRYTARGTLSSVVTTAETQYTRSDAFGQVLSQDAPGGTARTYTYDALGRALRPGFSYSGVGNDLAGDGTATYSRDPGGDLVGEASGSTRRIAWTDEHDDVVGQFGRSSATLDGSMTYDPLGKVLATSNMIGHLGYQSEWTEELTGRVNMWSRWYNTDTGQFDTRDTADVDPTPDSIGANRFAYADDNPLTETDPDGHWGLGGLFKKAKKAVSRTVHKAAKVVRKVAHKVVRAAKVVKKAVKKVVHKVRKAVKRVVKAVKRVYHKAKRYVVKKYHQARKWVAKKVAHVKKRFKRVYHRLKQAGKAVVAKATRVVKKTASKVRDAYRASSKWVKEHKKAIIEVAAIAGGVLAGIACTAATAGAGAVACMVGAAAVINVAKDAAEGNIHDWGDLAGSAGIGALEGLSAGAGGMVAGKVAGGVAGKFGGFGKSVIGHMVSGAAGGAAGDATTQFAMKRRVNLRQVGIGALLGAVFGRRKPKVEEKPPTPTGPASRKPPRRGRDDENEENDVRQEQSRRDMKEAVERIEERRDVGKNVVHTGTQVSKAMHLDGAAQNAFQGDPVGSTALVIGAIGVGIRNGWRRWRASR